MLHANVWEETAVAAPDVPRSKARTVRSVLVVGAGYLGLSAALHLAEAGVDVIVVDAHPPGWGASGRNGGQVIPGLKYDPSELEAMFGRERGERIWRFAGAAADFVFDLVARHRLDCAPHRAPWIQGIHSEKALVRARRRIDDWKARGADVDYLDRERVAAIAGTDIYLGGIRRSPRRRAPAAVLCARAGRVALAAGARIYRDATGRISSTRPLPAGARSPRRARPSTPIRC